MSATSAYDDAPASRPTGLTPPLAVIVLALLVILAVVGATRLPALLFPGPRGSTSVTTAVIDEHAGH